MQRCLCVQPGDVYFSSRVLCDEKKLEKLSVYPHKLYPHSSIINNASKNICCV